MSWETPTRGRREVRMRYVPCDHCGATGEAPYL